MLASQPAAGLLKLQHVESPRVGSLGHRFPARNSLVTFAPLATAAAAVVGVVRRNRRERHLRYQPKAEGRPAMTGGSLSSRARLSSQHSYFIVRRAEAELMGGFVTACSTAPQWQDAVDELAEAAGGGGFDAGFAFISEYHVTTEGLAPILEALREKLGVRTLIGCAGIGGIGQPAGPSAEAIDSSNTNRAPIEVDSGAAMSVGLLRDAAATPFFLGSNGSGDLQLIDKKAADKDVRSMLLMADPFGDHDSILKTLDDKFPKAAKAGGIAAVLQVGGAERNAYTPSIAIASEGTQARLVSQGIAGLMLSNIDIHTVVCQGCLPVGPALRVSSTQGPVCDGIGGKPSNETLRLIFSSVDPATRAKMQAFLTIGLGKVGENERLLGDGDWLVRMITGVTPQGGLVIGDDVAVGQPMRFHVRDRESAETDLSMMLKRYRLEKSFMGASGDPMGCFLFTCSGRGEGLYGRKHVDARAIREVLGDIAGSRVAGFFCNGEIGSPGLAASRSATEDGGDTPRPTAVHGFTAVFAILVPAPQGGSA